VVALAGEDEDKAGEAVLLQVRAVIVFVPNVAKKRPINWGAPVMSKNVLSAERR